MLFKNISIIIPVYNAALFIARAVESAAVQPETKEIILIEDGSTDKSLVECIALARRYDLVKLYTHSGNVNKGISASRNLGIRKATGNYIAFLDADDYYLPNRFIAENKIFKENPYADGVYGCIAAEFETPDTEKKFYALHDNGLTTIKEIVPSEKLFKALLFGGYGYFSTDSITVKKNVFLKTGLFNERLKCAEDSEMWLRLALKGKLLPGEITKPVAMRFVHSTNSTHQSETVKEYKNKMYYSLYKWSLKNAVSFENKNNIFNALLFYTKAPGYSAKKLFRELMGLYPISLIDDFFFKKFNLLYLKKDS
jgi:glycosyltransferase involved in cell wall biosynthesis